MDNPEGGASVKSHGQLPTLFGTSKNKAEVVNLVSYISNCFHNISYIFNQLIQLCLLSEKINV